MNSFKQKFVLLVLTLFTFSAFAQQAEKTLVKSFNIDKVDEVVLDIPGEVEVKHWNSKLMRIQMTITLANGSVHMLKSLVTAGRYNLDSTTKEGDYTIQAPNMARDVKLKGEPLQEKIAYTVFAPERISIKLANDTSTSAKEEENDASAL